MLETLAPVGVQLGMQMAQNQLNKAWQEKMYNQYQSPQAMVNQYKQAGLNPALMYGQNLQTEFNQPATQNLVDPIGSAYMAAQIKNMNAQTENVQADTDSKLIENAFKPDILAQNLARGWLDYDNTLAMIHKANKEMEEIDSRVRLNDISYSLTEAQIKETLASADKILVEKANEALKVEGIKANNRLIAAQVITEQQKPALQAMEIALMESQKYNYSVSSARTIEETNGVKLDNFERSWRNKFVELNGYEPTAGMFQSISQMFNYEMMNKKKYKNPLRSAITGE